MRLFFILFFAAAVSIMAGCSSTNTGKYFEDDGPPGALSTIGMETQNAVPKVEKPIAATNRPYTVMGKKYYPVTGDKSMVQTGYGSWYGKKFHGKKTSSGEVYDMYKMTAAHKTMELPSYAKVTNLENGRSVIVRVNDRGPFLHNRIIDLSYAAANKLGYVSKGTAKVKVERITRSQIASGDWDKSSYSGKTVLTAALSGVATAYTTKAKDATNKVEKIKEIAQQVDKIKEGDSTAREDAIQRIALAAAKQLEEQGVKQQPIVSAEVLTVKEDSENPNTKKPEVKYIQEGVFVMADGSSAVGKVETVVHNPQPSGFAVQIGVFKSKENAQRLLEKYTSVRDEDTMPKGKIVEANGLYKVLIGGNSHKDSAQELAQQLKTLLKQGAVVVKDAI